MVIRAQAGDRQAFVDAVRRIEQDLYAVARTIVRKPEDCADALQEAIYKAFRSLASLKQPEYFKSWMTRILINECYQLLRATSKVIIMEEIPETVSQKDQIEQSVLQHMELEEVMNDLNYKLRIVTVLHYLQDMSILEIAQVLDISENAVKARLFRARKLMSRRMQEYNEGGIPHGAR